MASKASITLPWGCWESGVGCPAWPESTLTAALWAARAQREMWAEVGFPAPLSEDFRSASLKGRGFPAVTEVRIHLQCRRHVRSGFGPRVGKIPGRRKWQPTPVFLPGASHGQRSLAAYGHGVAKSQTRLSDSAHTHS